MGAQTSKSSNQISIKKYPTDAEIIDFIKLHDVQALETIKKTEHDTYLTKRIQSIRTKEGETLLHVAVRSFASVEFMCHLMKLGGQDIINAQDKEQNTALHAAIVAIHKYEEDKMKLHRSSTTRYGLCSLSIRSTSAECKGAPPLVRRKSIDGDTEPEGVLRCLLQHKANQFIKNHQELTPLGLACYIAKHMCRAIDIMFEHKTSVYPQCPFHMICQHYLTSPELDSEVYLDLLTHLVRKRDVNWKLNGETCLALCLEHGLRYGLEDSLFSPPGTVLKYKLHPMIQTLLDHKADPFLANTYGRSPFMIACAQGDATALRAMLDFVPQGDPKLNLQDDSHQTALAMAISEYKTQKAITSADPREAELYQLQEVDGLLIPPMRGDFMTVINLLLDHKADLEVQDQFGNTALGDAADNNQIDVMTLLLERGANKSHQNKEGDTPYTLAYKAENYEAEDLLWDKSMLKELRVRNESKDDAIKTECLATPDPLELSSGLGTQPMLTMKRQNVEFFQGFKSPDVGKPAGHLSQDTPVAQDNVT